MYSLEDVRAEYRRLDALLGIDTSHICLEISKRSTQRLGSFRYPVNGIGELKISIAPFVLEDEQLFFNTIRHEYAHAAMYLLHPGEKHGHDAVWKNMCRKLGCMPSSCTELPPQAALLRRQKARYLVRCMCCGRESYYLRRGKVVDLMLMGRSDKLRCSHCSGHNLKLYMQPSRCTPEQYD